MAMAMAWRECWCSGVGSIMSTAASKSSSCGVDRSRFVGVGVCTVLYTAPLRSQSNVSRMVASNLFLLTLSAGTRR